MMDDIRVSVSVSVSAGVSIISRSVNITQECH